MQGPEQTAAWKKLSALAQGPLPTLAERFASEPTRAQAWTREVDGLWVDLSKNPWDHKILEALVALDLECQVDAKRQAMFTGAHYNTTEDRAVLHTALRHPASELVVDGQAIGPDVKAELAKVEAFVQGLHSGAWRGHSGKPIRHIVNIGIGGSDLGPKMVVRALTPYQKPELPKAWFVSNVDGAHLHDCLQQIDLDQTLFVIASKTFSTLETMTNAHAAKAALLQHFDGDTQAVAKHFVALSTNRQAVIDFGMDPANMFAFWDWVGGRFSLWSAIGFSIAASLGYEVFAEVLAGGHAMDQHFLCAPTEQNLPKLLALLGIWQSNFMGCESHALLPYSEHLEFFAPFLQQLDMESNGKSVGLDGQKVQTHTGPVVWGQPGTNGQHAFFQLLHQGTRKVSTDFFLAVKPHHKFVEHHKQLISNCLAQTQALMLGKSRAAVEAELLQAGKTEAEVAAMAPHRVFEGNRSSTTILYEQLTPFVVGQLVALYEHKIFVQGAIWGLNSFDQFGVELGKVLAKGILKDLEAGQASANQDGSTASLLQRILR
jgi:glucose-6-phosphate isomerase